MLKDVNREPRRWADRSQRVRVIEGWHPSQPSQIGYNLLVNGTWIGTFGTLEDAVAAATAHPRLRDGKVVLRPSSIERRADGESVEPHLRLVHSGPLEN